MRVCLFFQANKRKQAASTNQKRLDLFTPGVVASFSHQENLQNLTYYQSTYVDGDALQICDGDDDESEE